MYSLKKRTYLITGANSGIGRCVSEALMNEGAKLFMVDRDVDCLESLHKRFAESAFMQFDLNHPDKVEAIFKKAKSQGFVFDGMVYCAGISPLMTLKELDINLLQATFNINVLSFVTMTRFFMDEQYTNASSSIVGLSSSTSVIGGNRQYAYSASKSAMNLVMKSCVKELSLRKTRINAILPSITNTEMVAKLRQQSDAIDANVKYKMPFGILNPQDIANAIMYLLSDDSSAISGILLPVNNGEVY